VLALAYPEGDFYPSVVAVAIFWVFIIRAYLLFKKEHPKMYEALWRSQDESNKGS
jgi:preprotein translocase subunit YajC